MLEQCLTYYVLFFAINDGVEGGEREKKFLLVA